MGWRKMKSWKKGAIVGIVLVLIIYPLLLGSEDKKGGIGSAASMVQSAQQKITAEFIDTRKIPPPENFTLIGTEYEGAYQPTDFNGDLLYMAFQDGKWMIVHNGNEYGRKYDKIRQPLFIDNKFAYMAKKGDMWLIVYDGREILPDKYNISSGSLFIFGDSVGYEAVILNGSSLRTFIVYGEQEVETTQYDRIYRILEADGKLVYEVLKENKRFIIYDGQEVGTKYDMARDPMMIDGKFSYHARDDGKEFIVLDGKEIGREYDVARNPIIINGTLVYRAEQDREGFLVYDGKKLETEYGPGLPKNLGGKLAYSTLINNREFFVYDGKLQGSEYTWAKYPVIIDSELAYHAKDFIVYDGKEIGKQYAHVGGPVNVGGKLAFAVEPFILIEN